jgi:hypothetical protein
VNIVRAVLLAKNLEVYLDELDIAEGTLICDSSVDEAYASVVADVAADSSLNFKRERQLRDRLPKVLTLVSLLAKVMLLFADWVVGRIIGVFQEIKDTDIIYVPALERLESSLDARISRSHCN